MNILYFTDYNSIDEKVLSKIEEISIKSSITDVCVFPDVHYCSEKSIPVGIAFASYNRVFPLITGKDMGCGVAYMKIPKQNYIKPFKKEKHYRAFYREHQSMTDEMLGGGNHFLSLEESTEFLYIIIHTGTRNRGIYMYQYHTGLIDSDTGMKPTDDWYETYNNVILYGKKRRHQFLDGTLKFLVRNSYVIDGNYYKNDSVHNHIKKEDGLWIHRKGSTELNNDSIVIPVSMTRGSFIVKQKYDGNNLNSCCHGAGRKLSRTNTLKHWHAALKNKERKQYKKMFSELLDRSGNFSTGYIQEFDFAYKDSDEILTNQPFLKTIDTTTPICTLKFSY